MSLQQEEPETPSPAGANTDDRTGLVWLDSTPHDDDQQGRKNQHHLKQETMEDVQCVYDSYSVKEEVQEPVAEYEKGNELLQKRKYDEAMEQFKQMREIDGPARKLARIGMARVCLETEDYIQAKLHSSEALIADKNNFDGWLNSAKASIGLSLKAEKDPKSTAEHVKDAIEALNKCIRIRPDHAEAFTMRGKLFDEQGEYTKALKAYNESLNIAQNPEVILDRAQVNFKLRKYKDTIDDADSVLQVDSKNVDAILLKGEVHAEQKEGDLAIKYFLECNQLKPTDLKIKEKLVNEYIALKSFDNALEICTDVSSLSACQVFFQAKKTMILMEQKRYDLALSAVKDAIKESNANDPSLKEQESTNDQAAEGNSEMKPQTEKDDIEVKSFQMRSRPLAQMKRRVTQILKKYTDDQKDFVKNVEDELNKSKRTSYWNCIFGRCICFNADRFQEYIHFGSRQCEMLIFKNQNTN
ncbi:stress-induced-phosphoprotein 1-like [Ditylenchus destructor]|nr:stress-induced-phosphoprotein 1-like [Ditylenchus destructor]